MNLTEKYLAFLLTALSGKKIISVPAGFALDINIFIVLSAVTFVDIIQIPFFYFLYDKGAGKIKSAYYNKCKNQHERDCGVPNEKSGNVVMPAAEFFEEEKTRHRSSNFVSYYKIRAKWMRWFKDRLCSIERFEKTYLYRISRRLSGWGVFLVSAWPLFGGGIWTSVLLGRLFGIPRAKNYLIIVGGSIFGALIIMAGTEGVFRVFVSFLWR